MSQNTNGGDRRARQAGNDHGRHDLDIGSAPHPETESSASAGFATSSGSHLNRGELRHPILDGASTPSSTDALAENPYRGMEDPADITRQPALNTTRSNRWIWAGVFAAVIDTIVLLALFETSPTWSLIGIAVAILGVGAMLYVRQLKLTQRARLRVDALLLAVIWVVPLAIAGSIFWTIMVQLPSALSQ